MCFSIVAVLAVLAQYARLLCNLHACYYCSPNSLHLLSYFTTSPNLLWVFGGRLDDRLKLSLLLHTFFVRPIHSFPVSTLQEYLREVFSMPTRSITASFSFPYTWPGIGVFKYWKTMSILALLSYLC